MENVESIAKAAIVFLLILLVCRCCAGGAGIGKTMKAPGRNSVWIPRSDFESSPQSYFSDLPSKKYQFQYNYLEKESWDMNTQEKIEAAGKKKEEGNVLFKAGKYVRASKRYKKAVSFIEYDSLFSDDEKQQAKLLKVSCNLNNAACMLKLKEYKEAAKLCSKVLEIDSKNVKALYRRAQAYIQLVDLDVAELDIKKALEIDPENRDVKLQYKVLKEKIKEYNKKDAQFYGNIFAKMNKLEQSGRAKNEAAPMAIDSKA